MKRISDIVIVVFFILTGYALAYSLGVSNGNKSEGIESAWHTSIPPENADIVGLWARVDEKGRVIGRDPYELVRIGDGYYGPVSNDEPAMMIQHTNPLIWLYAPRVR